MLWARDSQAATAGAQIVAGPGILGPVQLTAGAADATATIYDGTGVGGRRMLDLAATAGTSSPLISLSDAFGTGLFAVVVGAGSRLSFAHV